MASPLALDDGLAALLVVGPLAVCAVLEHRRFRGDRPRRLADPTYRRLQAWQHAGLFLGIAAARGLPAGSLGGPPWLWPVVGCAASRPSRRRWPGATTCSPGTNGCCSGA